MVINLNIYGKTIEEFEKYLENNNEKKFHAKQLFKWLYQKKISDINQITDMKKTLLEKLKEDFALDKINIIKKEEDKDTIKYLFKLKDNQLVEAVLMYQTYGKSVCISSEVGCNMACKFCDSGRRKKVRSLTTEEMVLQILMIEEDIKTRISHVVVMGIGEPFDNYENLIKFISIINNNNGLAIGARHITVSTCGIVPKIKEFTKLNSQVNLAISLHAPTNEIRNSFMPINRAYPIEMLMESLHKYVKTTNRRITIEYLLLKDINDTNECAIKLSKLLKGLNCYVNLIPYNETENIEYKRSNIVQINKFYDILKKNNINVTLRKEFGSNISAACGQLRSKEEKI